MAVPVGTLLSGRYRLDAVIGTGGMSTVYLAFDTVLERQVAIKLMHREIARESDQLERFRREARAVAQLNHAHVVKVIDAGEDEGNPYIVFEYVDGETLKERIRRHGRLTIPESIAYAIEIGRALSDAHAHAIVHRDVKPQNVLIDEEGTAKVTDFGIARTLDQEGLTGDGRVLGTTDYVSPEQALGHPVTGQSDLYSLGIVLFEMLTGDVPFHGENPVAVAMRHVREELPDLQLRRPEVSSALAAVVDRATDKDLSRRYAHADDLIADLGDVLTIETARAGAITGEATAVLRTVSSRSRRRVPLRVRLKAPVVVPLLIIVVAAIALVLVALAGKTHRGTGPSVAASTSKPTATVKFVPLSSHAANTYDPLGDHHENDAGESAVVDSNPGTYWSTENYHAPLGPGGVKPGVGIYVDAAPSANGVKLEVISATPGWSGAVYVANGSSVPATFPAAGWVKAAAIDRAAHNQTVTLGTNGKPYRYYLVWITKLPPGSEKVELAEIELFQKTSESKASG